MPSSRYHRFVLALLATLTLAAPSAQAETPDGDTFDYLYDHILLGDTPDETASVTTDTAASATNSPAPKTESVKADDQSSSPVQPVVPAEVFVKLESLGTISSAAQCAMEKSVWKDQSRSEIYNQMATLPARQETLWAQTLQKNLLLSQTDAALIDNNIKPEAGKDLFDLRLQKLMEMGLIDEALALYRATEDEPYHENLARTGMLLMIYHGDFATACLEEKVLASKYPDSRFWQSLDQVCQIDLGAKEATKAQFTDSPTLQKIFASPSFVISALDQKTLSGLTALERGILAAQNRIDYSGLAAQPSAVKGLRSDLLALYLHQKDKPESLVLPLQNEAFGRGLIGITAMRKLDPDYKRLFEMETPEQQWAEVAKKLDSNLSPESLRHYGSMISMLKPAAVSPAELYKSLSIIVTLGETVVSFWSDELMKRAEQNPENYIYLQVLDQLAMLEVPLSLTPDQIKAGLKALPPGRAAQVMALTESLDSPEESHHNPLKVYEKDVDLTEKGGYVMPTVSLLEMVGTASGKQQTGLAVLLCLHAFQGRMDQIHPDTLRAVLSGLNRVGLIEESRKLSQEWLAQVLLTQATKGE